LVVFLFRLATADMLLPMSDSVQTLPPGDPADLATALAFALGFQGRKRVHNADELMAEIVAKRLVGLCQT
jgi:hypothetical protein